MIYSLKAQPLLLNSIFSAHNLKLFTIACLYFSLFSCTPKNSEQAISKEDTTSPPQEVLFYWQGHRGARGLLPENTIPAFLKALDLGMNTMEMDVVITKDGQVVVSHEPFLSHAICLDSHGNEIPESKEKEYNIFQYTFKELQVFDCGIKGNPRFTRQSKIMAQKPLLSEVIEKVEARAKALNIPVFYNIEIKSQPEWDNLFHPEPAEFVKRVYGVIEEKGVIARSFIQSFDVRPLQILHEEYKDIKTVLLVENELSFEANLQRLGFTPSCYSPYFKFVDARLIEAAHAQEILVIPWTVNYSHDMKMLIDLGVDGIITDYPDLVQVFFWNGG